MGGSLSLNIQRIVPDQGEKLCSVFLDMELEKMRADRKAGFGSMRERPVRKSCLVMAEVTLKDDELPTPEVCK